MHTPKKVVAGLTATAIGASALIGVTAAGAVVTDEPLINEFVTDTAGTDILEYAEILVPDGFDASDLHVIGVEGDDNSNQGKAVHVYSLADLQFDDEGRGLLTVPTNGLQNGSLSLLLVNGSVSENTVLDADLDGVIDDGHGLEILDAVGVHDGDNGAMAWGTELRTSMFSEFSGTLGGASRVPDASDDWVPNSYSGAGLDGASGEPSEAEAWNTPGAENLTASEGTEPEEPEESDEPGEPDPGETEPDPGETEPDPGNPGEVCDSDFTLISEVQGAGASPAMNGEDVTVQGVVTGDFSNSSGDSNGFYLQEEEADYDGDSNTSEAIFVYTPNASAPEQGTLVTVKGQVGEHYELGQLTDADVTECGEAELPAPQEIDFPVDQDNFESLESMRVNIAEAVVLETYQFGRYGQTVVGPERQYTPTSLHAPGSDEAQQLYQENLANQITIDDRRSDQNPDPAMHPNGEEFTIDNIFRGGDTFRNITGVLDYRFDTWAVQQTEAAEYENTVPRESEVPDVGGDVQVAAFNVLNYFTTFGSRGAENAEEFARQKDKLVAAIGDLGADVVGLMEIENDAGNEDNALNDLVDGVNEYLGEDRYVAVETGQLGTDEITTAMMYDADAVTPEGAHQVLDGSVDSGFDTNRHRPGLAQTFTAASEDAGSGSDGSDELGEFTVITNHLKSKGSECGSEGDNTHLVGSCDAERTAAAEALVDWAETEDLPKPVIMGDLNAYDHEAPITALEDGGYLDLKKEYEGDEAYSYVFDGQLGYLDYAMAHEDIMPFVTGAASWHTNSDEVPITDYTTEFKQPAQQEIYADDVFRSSDHDPVVFGLSLTEDGSEPEEPGEGDIPIDAEIPGLPDPSEPGEPGEDGNLVLTVDPGSVTMNEAVNAGDRLQLSGVLPSVSVTDTRADAAGWSVAGQASDLARADGSGSIAGGHLGWSPEVQDTSSAAQAGADVGTVMSGGTGLASPQVLGSADGQARLGTTLFSAGIDLEVPVDTEAGDYRGALSVSLFPVD